MEIDHKAFIIDDHRHAYIYIYTWISSMWDVSNILNFRIRGHCRLMNYQVDDMDEQLVYGLVWLRSPTKLLYFEWSPPWHVGWRLSGEGCHWEYDGKNGEFENIDFRFPWLSDTSEMGFGHDFFWYIFWHSFWHIFWHSFWHLSDISFDILSDKSFDTLSDISSDILSDISFDMLSDISKPKPNIHSFTKKSRSANSIFTPHHAAKVISMTTLCL